MANEKIAIIEDEKLIRWSLKNRLEKNNFTVIESSNGREGIALVLNEIADLVLLDYKLPDIDGIEVLKSIKEKNPEIPIIIMTAYASLESAIEAIKNGAFDYIHKPFEFEELLILINKALEMTSLKREVEMVRREQEKIYGIQNIIGKSESMKMVLEFIQKISTSPATLIYIAGEPGTGKKKVATAIHYSSNRANHPFLNVVCYSFSEALLEVELFGSEKEKENGQKEIKKGVIELAGEGSVFLEEICFTTTSFQQTFLRVLEEKKFRRCDGTTDIPVKCRFIVSCGRCFLDKLVESGKFLKELYEKIALISIEVPPLRKRKEDIPLLATHFINYFNKEFKKNFKGIKNDALEMLMSYAWPGNVRELRNVIEKIMIMENKPFIEKRDLPNELVGINPSPPSDVNFLLPPNGINIEDVEKSLILQALERTGGNQTKASKLLGLTRDTLRYRMKKFSLKF